MTDQNAHREELAEAVLCKAGVCCLHSPLSGLLTHMYRPVGLGGVVGAARSACAQPAPRGGSAGCAAGSGGCAGSSLRLQCWVAKTADWYMHGAVTCHALGILQGALASLVVT